MQALTRAADRGVKVRIYLDGTQLAEREPAKVFNDLAGHLAIAGGIEHVDLAACGRHAEREGKSPARRGARAGATIGSRSRNKGPVWSRLRWPGGKTAGEKRRGDGL
jgi:hypothetical protein